MGAKILFSLTFWFLSITMANSKGFDACLQSIKTDLDRISEEVDRIDNEKITVSSNSQIVTPLRCNRLVQNIVGNKRFYPDVRERSEQAEKASCLELQKIVMRKKCECAENEIDVSSDPVIIERSMAAYRRMSRVEEMARSKGIRDPAIKKFVDDASKLRDCWSEKTLLLFDKLSNTLEISSKMPSATVTIQPIEGGQLTTTPSVAKIDGGLPNTTAAVAPIDGGRRTTTVNVSAIDGGVRKTTVAISPIDGGVTVRGGSSADGLGSVVESVLDIAGAAIQGYAAGRAAGGYSGGGYSPPKSPPKQSPPGGDYRPGRSDVTGTEDRH